MAKFSRAERQAYNSGMGYAVGFQKKGINFSKPKLRKSFAAGFKKGNEMMGRTPDKYPKLKRKRSSGSSSKKG